MNKRDLKTLKEKTLVSNMDMNIATLPKKGLKKYDYTIYMDMEKKNLKRLTKGQLIKLLMNQRKKPTPPPRTGK